MEDTGRGFIVARRSIQSPKHQRELASIIRHDYNLWDSLAQSDSNSTGRTRSAGVPIIFSNAWPVQFRAIACRLSLLSILISF